MNNVKDDSASVSPLFCVGYTFPLKTLPWPNDMKTEHQDMVQEMKCNVTSQAITTGYAL